MGNAAGLKAMTVLENAERALAIELLAGAQAVEFLAPLQPGGGVAAARTFVRSHSERLGKTALSRPTSSSSPSRSGTAPSSPRSRPSSGSCDDLPSPQRRP